MLAPPTWSSVPGAEASLVRARVVEGCASDGDHDRCEVRGDPWGDAVLRFPTGRCVATPGDVIEAVATVRPFVPARNAPRDPASLVRVLRGVRWTMDAAACEVVGRDATVLDVFRRAALRVRQGTERALARSLDRAHADRARALLFGDRTGLDHSEHEAFRESGMAHLLAVSGAHVSLLIVLVGAVARRLFVRVPALAMRGLAPRLALVVPLPTVGFFVLVTGEAPSSLRALLTAAMGALAAVLGRRADGEATVAFVALFMAVFDPTLVADIGWVLSVVAAWSLARKAPRDDHFEVPSSGFVTLVRNELYSALMASARVGAAVLPVLAWHFGRTPLTATVMNAIAAPVGEALLLPSVLVAALAGAMLPSSVAALLCKPVGVLLGALFTLPSVAMRLPFAAVSVPMPTRIEWIVATIAVVVACGHRTRHAALIIAAGAAMVGVLELTHRATVGTDGALRITALDVGQGDAVVVELPDGAVMLIDGGGAITGGPDPGEREVVPWLALRRAGTLAAVVLSHPHPDHAGGLAAVLRSIAVREVWDTGQGRALGYDGVYGAMVREAEAREVPVLGPSSLCGPPRWFHGAWIEVLAPCPAALDATPPNDASFVIRITHGRARALLPGDLEREGEEALLARVGTVDVLKVGHHGSRTSSTDAWLDALRPRVALVSCGHPSPFGHPHAEVVERFRARGITLRRTDLSGAVSVTLHADGRVE
jgi:competence protein ComEC